MKLLLHEAYLLLGIDDEKGHFTDYSGFYSYGFVTAILLDMVEQGFLEVQEGRVVVKSRSKSGNKTFNRTIEVTDKFKKPQKVENWIQYAVVYSSKLYKYSLERLIKQQILKQTYWKFLWIFKFKRYPTKNAAPEQELIKRLHAITFEGVEGSTEDRKLLKLLQVGKQLKPLFPDKKQRKEAEEFIKTIPGDNIWGAEFEKAIKQMEAAMMAAAMG